MGGGASKKTQGEIVEAAPPPRPVAAEAAAAAPAADDEGGGPAPPVGVEPHDQRAADQLTPSPAAAPAEEEAAPPAPAPEPPAEHAAPSPDGKLVPEKPRAAAPGARRPRPAPRATKGAGEDALPGPSAQQSSSPPGQPAAEAAEDAAATAAVGGAGADPAPARSPPAGVVDGGAPERASAEYGADDTMKAAEALPEPHQEDTPLGDVTNTRCEPDVPPVPALQAELPRRKAPLGALPALSSLPDRELPAEELVPLAEFQKGWQARSPHDALLDRVVGPMVHDALRSTDWKVHWEALQHLSQGFAERASGTPGELTAAVGEAVIAASKSKMPKVFLASLAVLDALLQDPRTASLDQDEFVALFRGRQMLLPVEEAQAGNADDDCLLALLDQAEEGGGSSKASSPHQAAAAAICSCIRSGKLPLSEAAWPLLGRIDDRLRSEAAQGKMDKKEAALGPKCLATNFRLLGGWIREFGLQSGGLFRRALVLPLVLRGLASEHSKVRAAAGEALVPMLTAGGDLEERLWALLPSKRRRAAKELLASQEMPPGPCHDDLVPKTVVVSTDARAAGFTCASELTAEVWAGLLAGQAAAAATAGCGGAGAEGATAARSAGADADEGRSEALRCAVASKSWKDRCDAIARVSEELAASTAPAELVKGAKALLKSPRRQARHAAQSGWGTDWRKSTDAVNSAGSPARGPEEPGAAPPQPQLSQYVLCGYQVSLLQSSLVSFLGDSVTAVFIAAADLLQKVCERVPADAAAAVWEPSMGPLIARLPDTSAKVRAKASEAILALAGLHAGAVGEAVAAAVAGPGPAGEAADAGRCAGPRLQLLARLVEQARAQNVADAWTDGAWTALTRFAAAAAEHRSAEVRKESALLLTCCGNVGGYASSAADAAMASLQAAAQQKTGKRPGTANGRPGLEAMVVTSTTYGGDSPAHAGAGGAASEGSEEELHQQASSKNWKERAECISLLSGRVTERPQFVDGTADGALLCLSSCTLGGHRVPLLQSVLAATLGDTVTGVFAQAAGLLQLACERLPPHAGEAFLEPLLPPLLARLQDTSTTTQKKAMDVILSVASSNNNALGEAIARALVGCEVGAAGGAPPPTPGGSSKGGGGGRDADRGAVARLQLLTKMAQQAPRGTPMTSRSPRAPRTPKAPWDQVCQQEQPDAEWKEETWHLLADYAVKASEHRSGDVRQQSAALLAALSAGGPHASAAAEAAAERIRAVATEKACKRPGTGGGRLGTAAGRGGSLGASGRLSTGAGRAPSLGASGRQPSRGPTSVAGSLAGARPSDDDSDASACSQAPPDSSPNAGAEVDGVRFFDVQTACPGADVAPDMEEGEAALKEALQLAEPLQDESRDLVAPLVGLFGEGWARCFYSKNWQCRVAALTYLAASIAQRLEGATEPGQAPGAAGDLFGGALRAVVEGLDDQNVRVYAEACMATTAIVPAFTSIVDGRLLVSHLAPLLRLLCTRMGDLKEAVRTQTTQALFRLLRPPVGELLSPGAVAVLILRHLAPGKHEDEAASPPRAPSGKGATVAWLCRLAALRDLVKEYPQASLMQPGSTHPGEWLRLQAGLGHSDPTVRHESARLLALVCKMHLRGAAAEADHETIKEAWVAALQDVPAKSLAQVRKLLKLPERQPDAPKAPPQGGGALAAAGAPWEVPQGLADWAGCPPEVLAALRAPAEGSEDAVAVALRALTEAAVAVGESGAQRRGASLEEAFAGICAAAQRALASPVGADRAVFLGAVRLCQGAITHMASALSGLDISMGLAKVFPTLMERTSLAGASDVRLGVASDKFVQQIAKHPKVGCESVTKMVVSAVSRTERPVRPLVLLRTLLSDFGLRLCAQRDIVAQLLQAVGAQLERLGGPGDASGADNSESLRPQLVGVLATCSQFSMDTVKLCMGELEPSQRKLLLAALHEAPDPRLVALGAAAAAAAEGHAAGGSGIRALSRSNSRGGLSESPSADGTASGDFDESSRRSGSRRRLPRPEDGEASDTGASPAPGQRRRRRRFDPTQGQEKPPATGDSRLSEASTFPGSTAYSSASSFGEVSAARPPRSPAPAPRKPQPWCEADPSRGFVRSAEQPLRPPAPLGLSTLRGPGRGGGIPMPRPPENHRSDGEGLGPPMKSRSQDGLGALADVLAQMEGVGGHSRTR